MKFTAKIGIIAPRLGVFIAIIAAAFTIGSPVAQGAAKTWNKNGDTGSTSRSLNDTANWTGGLPGNGDNAFLFWNRSSGGSGGTQTVTNKTTDIFIADSLSITNASSSNKGTVVITLNGQMFLTNGVGALNFAGTTGPVDISMTLNNNLSLKTLTFSGSAGSGNATLSFNGGTIRGDSLVFNGNASGNNFLNIATTLSLSNNMTVANGDSSNTVLVKGNTTVGGRLSVAGSTSQQYFTLTNSTMTISNGVSNIGRMDVANGGIFDSVNAWTNNGVLNVVAGGRITGGTLTNQSNGTITDAGVIDALLINQGRLNFGGTVSNDLVSSGTVQLNNTATITQTANADGGTFNLAGNNLVVGQLSMIGGVFSNTGNARLILNGNATGNTSASKAIITGGILDLAGGSRTFTIADGAATIDMQVSAVVSNGGLIKAGPGTLELTGANNYTGGTTISDGTLRVNNATGSGTGTGAVTIESGGTLGGTGSVSGLLTVNAGGTLALGNSVGALQLGSLDLNPASTLQIEIASPTSYDKLSLTGSATLGGNLDLVFLDGYTPDDGDSFTILSAAGGISGTFDSITDGYAYGVVGNDLIVTVVPEPSAFAMAGLGIFLLLVTSRRRWRCVLLPRRPNYS